MPLYIRYLAGRGRSPLKGVVIDKGERPKLVSAGARILGFCAWLPPKNKPPLHMYYHIKFGTSATKGVHINRMEPLNRGALGPAPFRWGVAMTP